VPTGKTVGRVATNREGGRTKRAQLSACQIPVTWGHGSELGELADCGINVLLVLREPIEARVG